MEIGLGQLTFLTDGIDYACIWSPSGEDHTRENARALSLIAIALVKDQADFLAWQKNINDRWLTPVRGSLTSRVNTCTLTK